MCGPQMEPPRRTWVPGHWNEVSAQPLGSVGSLASEEGGRRTAGEKSGAQLWPETLQVGLGAVGKEPKQQVLNMSSSPRDTASSSKHTWVPGRLHTGKAKGKL